MAQAFNDPRRSKAFLQLTILYSQGLLSVEERTRFSPETCEVLERLSPSSGNPSPHPLLHDVS
jgi:hypothetical protein